MTLTIEGTEFETGDRYTSEAMAAGGYELWLQRLDADPRRWTYRLDLAPLQVAAMIQVAGADTHLLPTASYISSCLGISGSSSTRNDGGRVQTHRTASATSRAVMSWRRNSSLGLSG